MFSSSILLAEVSSLSIDYATSIGTKYATNITFVLPPRYTLKLEVESDSEGLDHANSALAYFQIHVDPQRLYHLVS